MSDKTWAAGKVDRPINAVGSDDASDNIMIAFLVGCIRISFAAPYVILGVIVLSPRAVLAPGAVASAGFAIIKLATRPKKETKITEEISIEEENRKLREEYK